MPVHQGAAALAELAAGMLAGSGPEALGFVPPVPLYLRRPDAKVPAGFKAVLPAAGEGHRQ
jgi:hypothetical protein